MPGNLRGARWAVLATKIHDTAATAVLIYVNTERTGRGCVTGRGLAAETAAYFRAAEREKLLSNVTASTLTGGAPK